jgi:hypothetical protein
MTPVGLGIMEFESAGRVRIAVKMSAATVMKMMKCRAYTMHQTPPETSLL